MLADHDLGRGGRSSRQTLDQYLGDWLNISAQPRIRAATMPHDQLPLVEDPDRAPPRCAV
jgi:hypothetical protein